MDKLQARASGAGMQPFYFTSGGESLFGCYEVPGARAARDCAVVLCYPMGHEYVQAHRAFLQLARRLAKAGFPVLRFDYGGCGDSSGDGSQARLSQWRSDIGSAIDEVRRRSGTERVCLVGLRLGATLAVQHAAAVGNVDGIVLWDPIVSGKESLKQLKQLHGQMVEREYLAPVNDRGTTPGSGTEVFGFLLTEAILEELPRVELLANVTRPARQVLVVESREAASQEESYEPLRRAVDHFEYRHCPSTWIWREDYPVALVPNEILQAVVSWMSKVYP